MAATIKRLFSARVIFIFGVLSAALAIQPSLSWAQITKRFLLSFHTCNTAELDCNQPSNFTARLAGSDDGITWTRVSGSGHRGSVPDVIRRGNTIYVYTPGHVRRFRMETNTWELRVPVTLQDPNAVGFVDPSLIFDQQGKLVLFYLPGTGTTSPGGPATCGEGETSCIKSFRSATEVEGSDGTEFIVDEGDRATVTLTPTPTKPDSASDPDIFFDGEKYILYVSRGPSTQVYISHELRGTYTLSSDLPAGFLTQNIGGVASGLFDPDTRQYLTYVHIFSDPRNFLITRIRRAAHDTLDSPLTDSDLTDVVTGESIGLGPSFLVASPGIALNEPQPVIPVKIDIKPGSFPNSINLGSGGSVPVAIFSTLAFDATTVDPITVTLASAPVQLKGKGTPMSSFQDVNGDGLQDLVVHVSTEALQLNESDTVAVLEGQTFAGAPIKGRDTVRIVP